MDSAERNGAVVADEVEFLAREDARQQRAIDTAPTSSVWLRNCACADCVIRAAQPGFMPLALITVVAAGGAR
jgi:hypothetical protein